MIQPLIKAMNDGLLSLGNAGQQYVIFENRLLAVPSDLKKVNREITFFAPLTAISSDLPSAPIPSPLPSHASAKAPAQLFCFHL